eukprot:m.496841 g.496841  ORF g.496841 m.496841 type:complete len:158 (-) comp57307_c1_seq12:211-684(-)
MRMTRLTGRKSLQLRNRRLPLLWRIFPTSVEISIPSKQEIATMTQKELREAIDHYVTVIRTSTYISEESQNIMVQVVVEMREQLAEKRHQLLAPSNPFRMMSSPSSTIHMVGDRDRERECVCVWVCAYVCVLSPMSWVGAVNLYGTNEISACLLKLK